MTQLTTLDQLQQNITLLACVEESEAPFISCYLNLEDGPDSWRKPLYDRASVLRRILKGDALTDLETVLEQIEAWLTTELHPDAKGVALFVRGVFGGAFMLPMQFGAPLPNWITVYPTPNIYHLVELKDNYHRYVVLLAMPNWARILEVNLGAATTEAWLTHSESRLRVGSEWSRSHYQVNRTHRGGRFLREKIAVLERLMEAGGHTHLILAGAPDITERVRRALPEHLADRLVDVIPASNRDHQADVVMATLSSFIEHEERESQTLAEHLFEGVRSQNLAVAGALDSLAALRRDEVDTLIMANDFQPDPGWRCEHCQTIGSETPDTSICPHCGHAGVRAIDVREALLRLAGQLQCPVEVVEQSDTLMSLGGVGCLLRTDSEPQVDLPTLVARPMAPGRAQTVAPIAVPHTRRSRSVKPEENHHATG